MRKELIVGLSLLVLFPQFRVLATELTKQTITDNAASEREQNASEDPLVQRQVNEPSLQTEKAVSDFEFYANIRFRSRFIEHQGTSLEDTGSRAGVTGWYELSDMTWLFGRYELGFNVSDELGISEQDTQPGRYPGDSLFTRLGYAGIEYDGSLILFGKNWSTYYQVASFTDRFDSVGGEANGVYNAATDGGYSGTGRANRVLQARLLFDPTHYIPALKSITLNIQGQYGEEVPLLSNIDYGMEFGTSIVVDTVWGLEIGFAYNFAELDVDSIPPNQKHGIDGNLSALLFGIRWLNDDWYIGLTASKTKNLMAADNRQYFSGIGIELYGQYQLIPNVWLIGGLNTLTPDNKDIQVGAYKLDYQVFGLRYSFQDFSRMIYFESRLDHGKTSDNKELDNQFIVGMRWSF